MTCRARMLSLLIVAAAACEWSGAVTPEGADAIVKLVAARPAAEQKFERWVNEALLFAANECWSRRVPAAAPPAVLALAESGAASFAGHPAAELESACAELARSGVHPVCLDARVFAQTPPFDATLPPQYVQFERQTSAPVVTVVLACRLTARDVPGSVQHYTELATARWTVPPRVARVPTAHGARELRVGTLEVLVPSAGAQGEPLHTFARAVLP